MPSLGGWEIVIILAVLLLLFGAKKLPDMARSIGQSARVFKGEMKGLKDDDEQAKAPEKSTDAPAQASQELPPSTTVNQTAPAAQQTPVAQPAPAAPQAPQAQRHDAT